MPNPAHKLSTWIDELREMPNSNVVGLTRILREVQAAIDKGGGHDLAGCFGAKGIALAKLGREEEAIRAHRTARRLDPREFEHAFNMGITLGAIFKHAEESYDCFLEALELAGDDTRRRAMALNTIAATLVDLGAPEEARRAMTEAFRLARKLGAGVPPFVLAQHAAYVGMQAEAVEALADHVALRTGVPRGDAPALRVIANAWDWVLPQIRDTPSLVAAVVQMNAWGGRFPELARVLRDAEPASGPPGDDATADAAFDETRELRARANAESIKEHCGE